jgi:hypothetical protein
MNTQDKIIQNKLGVLKLAKMLGNVSQACKVMGVSRDSFYRFKQLYETGGETALQEISRKKPCIKNRVEASIEQSVVDLAIEQPALGQVRVSNELKKQGILVSPGGVRSIWLRHELETFQKRLKALEAKVAQDGFILTEAQLQALEKAKVDKEAHGEIETHHPGYLGSQDTFYVGTHPAGSKLQRSGTHLPANVYRHLLQSGHGQTLRQQNGPHLSRLAQRPGAAVF